jgi:hypothetical protein
VVVAGFLAVALAVWLVDSAVRGRPPISSLRDLITTGTIPNLGKSGWNPAGGVSGGGGTFPSTPPGAEPGGGATPAPSPGGTGTGPGAGGASGPPGPAGFGPSVPGTDRQVPNPTGVRLAASGGDFTDDSTNCYTGNSYDAPGWSKPSGNITDWINQASDVLAAHGEAPLSAVDKGVVFLVAGYESGFNPLIVNGWDSNAKKCEASKGIMQTIPSTFIAHRILGYGVIYDPVSNIIAGVRYVRAAYGYNPSRGRTNQDALLNTPGWVSIMAGGGYKPY